ncbi:MAG: hypothetical protein OK455_09680, partial [Thaumarchaeota archaeon]|nr:hypothetical protein [Nitrososphaerota archaeon]
MISTAGRPFVRVFPSSLAAALATFMFFASFATIAPGVYAQSPNVTVDTQANTGGALTGYWVSVTDASGNVVQSGFSPAQFSLPAGTYDVYVGDYGGEYFNHWADGTQVRSHAVSVTSSSSTSLTAVYCPQSGCGGSSILVNSQYSPSGNLTGMYVALASNGQTVATGFTPALFTTTSDQTYSVSISDYTNAYFFQWSTSANTRNISVTATGSQTALTALFCNTQGGCGGSTGSSISVGSQYTTGAALTGMYTVLQQGGQTVASGFTPVNFPTTNGQTYSVTVGDYNNAYFSQWSNGVSTRTITVTATDSQTSLTATYCQTQGCSSGGGTGNSITVTGSDLQTGTALTGFYVDLRLNNNHVSSGYMPATFSGLQTGVKYLVVVYWYGDYYFRHFSSGNLQRYAWVTLNATGGQNTYTMNALFESVPKSQAASLNI